MFLEISLGLGFAPIVGVEPRGVKRSRSRREGYALVCAGLLRVTAHSLQVYEELVALTGIERVRFQFSRVQFGLSRCIWVHLVCQGRRKAPYGRLW
jgi:hypothetical protein